MTGASRFVVSMGLSLLILSGAASAGGRLAVEIGYGSGIDNTWMARAGVIVREIKIVSRHQAVGIDILPLASAGLWRGDRDIIDFGLTPIFRATFTPRSRALRPFIEGAVGFHYISETQMRQRVFSTNFQFGDHLGIGIVVGRTRALEFAYLFQHLSNASIKRPNAGINFHALRVVVEL